MILAEIEVQRLQRLSVKLQELLGVALVGLVLVDDAEDEEYNRPTVTKLKSGLLELGIDPEKLLRTALTSHATALPMPIDATTPDISTPLTRKFHHA